VVAHAVPAFNFSFNLVVPGPSARFTLEQPVGHEVTPLFGVSAITPREQTMVHGAMASTAAGAL